MSDHIIASIIEAIGAIIAALIGIIGLYIYQHRSHNHSQRSRKKIIKSTNINQSSVSGEPVDLSPWLISSSLQKTPKHSSSIAYGKKLDDAEIEAIIIKLEPVFLGITTIVFFITMLITFMFPIAEGIIGYFINSEAYAAYTRNSGLEPTWTEEARYHFPWLPNNFLAPTFVVIFLFVIAVGSFMVPAFAIAGLTIFLLYWSTKRALQS